MESTMKTKNSWKIVEYDVEDGMENPLHLAGLKWKVYNRTVWEWFKKFFFFLYQFFFYINNLASKFFK